jgi:hypothetical protein
VLICIQVFIGGQYCGRPIKDLPSKYSHHSKLPARPDIRHI